MIRVKATREGLLGKSTASGYHIDLAVPFVALPSTRALGMFVRLRNPLNARTALAIVLDVGPWNEHDDAYVFQPATDSRMQDAMLPERRPAAEQGEHVVYFNGKPYQRTDLAKVNRAGIDLGEKVWHQLGMSGNTDIEWEFVL